MSIETQIDTLGSVRFCRSLTHNRKCDCVYVVVLNRLVPYTEEREADPER